MLLFAELKRRNVLRAGVLYIGAAWALSQGVAQLLPVFDIPNWVVRWFVIANPGVDFGNRIMYGGDLVTSYNQRANAFVVVPGGEIFGWNYSNFQSTVNHNLGWGRIYLGSGETLVNGVYNVSF